MTVGLGPSASRTFCHEARSWPLHTFRPQPRLNFSPWWPLGFSSLLDPGMDDSGTFVSRMGWALVTQQRHWLHLCAPGGLPGAARGHTLHLLWPQTLQKYLTPRWGSSPSDGLGVLIRAKWGGGSMYPTMVCVKSFSQHRKCCYHALSYVCDGLVTVRNTRGK